VASNVLTDGTVSIIGASTLEGTVSVTGAFSLAGSESIGGGNAATGATITDAGVMIAAGNVCGV